MTTAPPPHRLADLLPLIYGAEFEVLVADIAANGLRVPITLLDGKVLDGRNRLRACEVAEVEPRFEVFEGTEDEALALVLSLNLARRHLTTAQRAALALKILPLEEAAARRRQGARTDLHPDSDGGSAGHNGGQALDIAGRRVGVGRDSVWKARRIADKAPEVLEAMQDGTVRTLGEAERLAALKQDRREKILIRMRDEGLPLKRADDRTGVMSDAAGSCEWYTPAPILAAARLAMGGDFSLDPASHAEAQITVTAARYFTVEDDGLQQDWHAERVWLNPPFGLDSDGQTRQGMWTQKLFAEVAAGRVSQACLLVKAATDARWFGPLWAHPLCFVRGRVYYTPGPGNTAGTPTVPSVVVGVGVDPEAFVGAFGGFGQVVLPSRAGVPTAQPRPAS